MILKLQNQGRRRTSSSYKIAVTIRSATNSFFFLNVEVKYLLSSKIGKSKENLVYTPWNMPVFI